MFNFDQLTLRRPLSTTSPSDPDDVLAAKRVFHRLGYYEIPRYGLTPYPDQPLFDGIRTYQKDNDLTVDGVMGPGGETEQSVNFSLVTGGRTSDNAERGACAEQAIFALPGYPWRQRNYCPTPREKEGDDERQQHCWEQYLDDQKQCDRLRSLPHISAERRRARCRASASERYATCIRGMDPPPLDTGRW